MSIADDLRSLAEQLRRARSHHATGLLFAEAVNRGAFSSAFYADMRAAVSELQHGEYYGDGDTPPEVLWKEVRRIVRQRELAPGRDDSDSIALYLAKILDSEANAAERVAADVEAEKATANRCVHEPDFRSVIWYGQQYSFTPAQAAVVELLWHAWKRGSLDVGDARLREAAGVSETTRLSNVFRKHPAWNKMIQSGGTDGSKRLVPCRLSVEMPPPVIESKPADS